MATIGSNTILKGSDLPLDSPGSRYRSLVESIREDEKTLGAVITSHKLALYESCADLFTKTDGYADLARETNSIWKRDGHLIAGARDPLAVAAVLEEMLPPTYWDDCDAEILCLGAGGAATAIALTLLAERPSREGSYALPRRIIFADVRRDRLAALEATLRKLEPLGTEIDLLLSVERDAADCALRALPPSSLVINATGIGKDAPGSPLTDSAVFPIESVIWDLNYRGDLGFLRQARLQQDQRRLRIHDGWRYFLHGWFQALSPILQYNPDSHLFERFASASQ
jgi:shikimate dehydrogenase